MVRRNAHAENEAHLTQRRRRRAALDATRGPRKHSDKPAFKSSGRGCVIYRRSIGDPYPHEHIPAPYSSVLVRIGCLINRSELAQSETVASRMDIAADYRRDCCM